MPALDAGILAATPRLASARSQAATYEDFNLYDRHPHGVGGIFRFSRQRHPDFTDAEQVVA